MAQSPSSKQQETSESRPRGKLGVVPGGEKRRSKKAKVPPTIAVESPKQATVKMDERMRMAWALMRATSGRTLQELQYEAFHDYLKKHRAFDMVELHAGATSKMAES